MLKLLLILGAISLSQQQTVKITKRLIPDTLNEGDPLILECIVSNPLTSQHVEWLKEEEIVTNGSVINRNESNYAIQENINPDNGNLIYLLNITSVSENDFGRWTCRARLTSGNYESLNVVVNVLYEPGSMYPICGRDGSSLTCTTKEGNPRVSVEWFQQTAVNKTQFRRSGETDDEGIIRSEVFVSILDAPETDDESVVCETRGGSCSIPKAGVYNSTGVILARKEQEGEVDITCNTTVILPGAAVSFDWSTGEDLTYGKSRSELEKSIIFQKKDSETWKDTKVSCLLTWGALSYVESSIVLSTSPEEGHVNTKSLDGGGQKAIDESSNTWIIGVCIGLFLLVLFIVIMTIMVIRHRRKDNPV